MHAKVYYSSTEAELRQEFRPGSLGLQNCFALLLKATTGAANRDSDIDSFNQYRQLLRPTHLYDILYCYNSG